MTLESGILRNHFALLPFGFERAITLMALKTLTTVFGFYREIKSATQKVERLNGHCAAYLRLLQSMCLADILLALLSMYSFYIMFKSGASSS
jgi:hypothetical protein